MIEIITKEGISLDLKSNIDIEYTLEQPLMASDNMPVGISTTIAFPLSVTNRKVFGYWKGAFVGAINHTIPAKMLVNGIVVLDGELTFIGASEDDIEYSFRGAELPSCVEGKVYELPELEIISKSELFYESRSTGREDIAFPFMIRKTYVAECEHQKGTGTYYPSSENGYAITNAACNIADKYVNYGTGRVGSVAVVRVLWLLRKAFPNIIVEEEILDILSKLVIVAPNSATEDRHYDIQEGPYDEGDRNVLDLAKALPEISYADFLSNVLKMFAASVYASGQHLQIKSAESIFKNTDYVDWSQKASNVTSVSVEEAQAYELSFANSPESSNDNSKGVGDDDIQVCANLEELFTYFNSHSEIVNAWVAGYPDLFAGKKVDVSLTYDTVFSGVNIGWEWVGPLVPQPIIDNVNHLGAKSIMVDSSNAETFNYKIDFNCVRCVPAHIQSKRDVDEPSSVGKKVMCPVLDLPNPEGDRSSDIYIGLLIDNQVIPYGNLYTGHNWIGTSTSAGTERTNDYSISISGDNGLYSKFHKQFAKWITKRKHSFKMEVLLDISDIANLDLSRKVMIHNQLFIIKSATIKINSQRGIGLSEVELIEI